MTTSFVLQDWTTVQGVSPLTVTQAERDWADLAPFGDLMLWLEVAQASGPSYLRFETSPARDAKLFAIIKQITLSSSSTPQLTKVLLSEAPTLPLARWLRWTVLGDSSWTATFRITGTAIGQGT